MSKIESERERKGQTEHTYIHTERRTYRQPNRQTDREIDRHTDIFFFLMEITA